MTERIEIETAHGPVSGEWTDGRPVVVVAHGAGNDLDAPLLVGFTEGLAEAGVGSLRFNFPYKQRDRRAPDPPAVLRDTLACAFETASARAAGASVFVGGKSLGGRIAS